MNGQKVPDALTQPVCRSSATSSSAASRRRSTPHRHDRADPVLAANTAVQRVPGARLDPGQDRYLPRQLHTRGDRLAFSNGIIFLAAFASC